MNLSELLLVAAGSGVAGWMLENAASKEPRYSAVFQGRRVPFLPVYAAGGAVVALTAPHVHDLPWPARFAIYAGELTVLEGVAGHVERARGVRSWDYEGSVVDVPHTLLWGVLGLAIEGVMVSSSP